MSFRNKARRIISARKNSKEVSGKDQKREKRERERERGREGEGKGAGEGEPPSIRLIAIFAILFNGYILGIPLMYEFNGDSFFVELFSSAS
jgi:hypothetical protein